jgi:hypothetical protein
LPWCPQFQLTTKTSAADTSQEGHLQQAFTSNVSRVA